MTKLQELKRHLRPGRVYRREDLARWSTAVDRHLKQLTEEGYHGGTPKFHAIFYD